MVIGADIETVIAAEDLVIRCRREFFRDPSLLLDRQIRQTPAGIQDIGFRDGACRAGANAERASAA